MSNAFLLVGIIIQALLAAVLVWGIFNEKKIAAFERAVLKEIKAKKQRNAEEKLSAAGKNISRIEPSVYYVPVKPSRRRSTSSFDAA